MYGQGNHGPQFQHGLNKAMPPLQHRPPGPFPPPPPFQHGPSAPAHPIMQQGSLPVRPHVGHQPSQPVYQHAPPPPHGPVQQGPQVHGGMLNTGQSYLHPPLPIHGSAPLPHSYPSATQSSQYSAHLGNQNLHHIPPPVPPPLGPPHAEMSRAPLPPGMPPPPPPSQGQTLYRTSGLSVPGGVQGLQHVPPPPPPPPPRPPPPSPATSNYFSTVTYGSFLHPTPGGSHMSSMALPPPPPLPASPPPLPPSPPPPASPLPRSGTSSVPILAASDLPSISGSLKVLGLEAIVSDSVDVIASASHTRDDMTMRDDYINLDSAAASVMGSIVKVGSSDRESVILDFLTPPPRPAKEKIARSIETLCQLIAETGPDSEDMVRRKESGNPDFEFLIGGEPGSEASIAHEYFLWMKKKCNSEIILRKSNKPSESSLRHTEFESSIHADSLKDAGASHSPTDSDMEMEDDITQFDKDQVVHHSFEGSNPQCVMIRDELEVKEHLNVSESPPVSSLAKNASSRNVSGSGSSGLAEQAVVSEIPSDSSNLEKPPTCVAGGVSPSHASASSAGTESGKYSGQHIKGGSPFRLLQDYASDDSTDNYEPCLEDVSPVKVSSPVTVGDSSLSRDPSYNMDTDVGSKSLCRNEREPQPLVQAVLASSSMPIKAQDFSLEAQMNVEKTVLRSVVTVRTDEQLDGIMKLIHHSASQETLQEQDALEGGNVDDVLESGNSPKEDGKCTSAQLKVDEFGRLVRRDASDSESDDFRYMQRRGKRGRSWSRSLSPRDRRRRSPRRRRERRSRSRSWSPKKRRSRSKSPIRRRVGDYGGEKMRRDKGQIPDCLDFLRGKCHRGASCRFLHHDSDKTGGSRHYKSKQHYQEVTPRLNNNEVQEMQTSKEMSVSGFGARRDDNISDKRKDDSRMDDLPSAGLDKDGQFLVTDVEKPERLIEAAAQVHETLGVQEEAAERTSHLPDNDNFQKLVESHQPFLVHRIPSQSVTESGIMKSPGDTAELVLSSALYTTSQQPLTNLSVPVLQNADHQPQIVDGSSRSDYSPDQTSTTFPDKLPVVEPHVLNISSTQSHPITNSMDHQNSFDNSSSQLPPPPPLPLSQGMNAPHMTQLPKDYNLMQSTAGLQFQSTPGVSIPAYQAPVPNQQPHFSAPPNFAWASLPLPPPPPALNHLIVNEATGFPQFQQNHLPPRNDFGSQTFVRPYQADLLNHSQVGEFQHRYLSMQEHHRPPLHLENHQSKHLPVGNLPQSVGPNLIREDFPSSSYAQGNVHGQMITLSELYKSSSHKDSFSQQQPPPYGLQHSAADNIAAHLGLTGNTNSSTPRFPSDILERNQLSRLSDFGGSRISTHYNPYASTFDQPLSSKFSSSAFRQEKDTPSSSKYDASISLSHLPVDGLGAGNLGSRQMSSPNSARAIRQNLPRSDGDQYDPLFDSIEMSPNSFGKYDRVQKWDCTNDSDIMLRLSAAHKPLDVEENNKKKKKAGAIAAATSLENDEYGETADAEVGAVENGSPSSPTDMENTAAGEIEIDQIKSSGKRKKSKDSRSTRLFKSALADFVKEVLKPSWRQGNMSKEAFKTIVKKTVDKVSGAMKGHQIPKSQAKINQYIDSSQRKLTKLVMGYVDKYVKV